ncbi:winged helix-turn-helix domain-containing protein [Streptacidiphilus sp. N1-12]|uniref:Winged helix-turn-helix domain-containing protein n=2 Tax=Streptacidiphilus alkalitolerans TaxID=3342712 RepID=A0ABV6WMA5_9ACTN
MEAVVNSAPRSSPQKLQHVYDRLREEIARLGPKARLPSQNELVKQLNVSRDTVQRALKWLQEEGLVHSVQGRGTFVAELTAVGADAVEGGGPVAERADRLKPAFKGLGDYLKGAFKEKDVTIDFFGFTAETLSMVLKERLFELRLADSGSQPASLTIRLLLPAMGTHLALPRSIEDPADERPLDRLRELTARLVGDLRVSLRDAAGRQLIEKADLQVRTVRMTPQVKLYIINRTVALMSWYEIQRNTVDVPASDDSGAVEHLPIHDLMGVDALLIPQLPAAVPLAQQWFDSQWDASPDDSAPDGAGGGDALA